MQIEDLIIRREFRSTSELFGVAIRTDFWDSYAISRTAFRNIQFRHDAKLYICTKYKCDESECLIMMSNDSGFVF